MPTPQRIVSLLPSATEIVCALGLADRLVGVSHECDHPAEIVGRPILTEPKLDPRGTSAEIDAAVRSLVHDGLSVYRIREECFRQADPDLIVTQDQCDVCAVSLGEVLQAVADLQGKPTRVVSLRPTKLSDILADFERVADAAGLPGAGHALAERLQARFDRLRDGVKHVRYRPRVACIEWLDPLMIAGNWVPELVDLAGGNQEWIEPGERSRTITFAELADSQPEVIVLMPCGFRVEQTGRELPALALRPEWRALTAVRDRRIYSVDGNAYFNRPGPRIAESAELLAALVQPGRFAKLAPQGSWEHAALGAGAVGI